MVACECRLADHQHAVPCGVSLRLASRGVEGEGGWEAHHIVPESEGGSDKLENCAIMCWPFTVGPSNLEPFSFGLGLDSLAKGNHSSVRFWILSVMLGMGHRRRVQACLCLSSRLS